jgi:hypothetical protein
VRLSAFPILVKAVPSRRRHPSEGDSAASEKLRSVPPGDDVDMEGQGEILRIEARPANGERNLKVDASTGLIDFETFNALPEPYRVARYGASKKQLAITFDDGPDPEWTPKILDVLKRENAPAKPNPTTKKAAKGSGILLVNLRLSRGYRSYAKLASHYRQPATP